MYSIEVSEQAEAQLEDLDKAVQERVVKKIDDIEQKIQELGIRPNVAIEKRLRSPYHRILQQRVGDYRIWFYDDPEEEALVIVFVGHKEEAQGTLR